MPFLCTYGQKRIAIIPYNGLCVVAEQALLVERRSGMLSLRCQRTARGTPVKDTSV